MKIKIAVALGWGLVAPGIEALLVDHWALGRSVSGAMVLRFGGELAAEPIRVGRGFCMTYVDGPFLGEADFAKHRAK